MAGRSVPPMTWKTPMTMAEWTAGEETRRLGGGGSMHSPPSCWWTTTTRAGEALPLQTVRRYSTACILLGEEVGSLATVRYRAVRSSSGGCMFVLASLPRPRSWPPRRLSQQAPAAMATTNKGTETTRSDLVEKAAADLHSPLNAAILTRSGTLRDQESAVRVVVLGVKRPTTKQEPAP